MEKDIEFDEGWNLIQEGIAKLKNFLESENPQNYIISAEEYMMLYTTITDMCSQKPPHCHPRQLYDKYCETFEEYITSTVLPSLQEKHGELLLREFVKRWSNHKIMMKWLSRFFQYLERYYTIQRSLPTLEEVGLTCFRDLVYKKLKGEVRDVVISLINKEREGEQIDQALVKNIVDVSFAIGIDEVDENDFENDILKDTTFYYSRMVSTWNVEDSSTNYLLRAEESLKQEKERVSHYLCKSSQTKLLMTVQRELLTNYAAHLPEKAGSEALLGDDEVENLSKKYLLFSNMPRYLEPIAYKVMQHATAKGWILVEKDEDVVII